MEGSLQRESRPIGSCMSTGCCLIITGLVICLLGVMTLATRKTL